MQACTPDEARYHKYRKAVRYHVRFPVFETYRCKCCGNFFTREVMYELEEPSQLFHGAGLSRRYTRGCRRCFPDKKSFVTYCETELVLRPNDFTDPENKRKLMF